MVLCTITRHLDRSFAGRFRSFFARELDMELNHLLR